MASWHDLGRELAGVDAQHKVAWLCERFDAELKRVGKARGGKNVIFYGSSFLQKQQPNAANLSPINLEDMNGFMATVHKLDCEKGLTLILHTQGGEMQATQAIVGYLHSKFPYIEVVVPVYAFSAGTMIALASDRIVMGKQSQLGPIDAQIPTRHGVVSAWSIKKQFNMAKEEILANNQNAVAWAPILQTIGPSLIQQAETALEYGEKMVTEWLGKRMFAKAADKEAAISRVIEYFNTEDIHKNHGSRIDLASAKANGVKVEEMDSNDELQDAILTTYHLATILFEQTPSIKLICNDAGKRWIKSLPVIRKQ